ncbi:MAG: transcription elongation factor Spt5 [Candidatus Anstonellaceae archaeon]
MPIYSYRVVSGQEKIVMEMLVKKIKAEKLAVYSIIHIEDMKGYMFVEAENEMAARAAANKIQHIKGVITKEIDLKELEPLLSSKMKQISEKISKGDIVELTAGPFKGERAKVLRIDDKKDELVVELMDVAVPIPITIKANTIKLRQKAEET